MEDERWLAPNPWRYALLASVLIFAITGLAVTCSFLGPTGRVVEAHKFVTALAAFWAVFGGAFALGYFVERGIAWRVGSTGISIHDTKGRQIAILAWAEVAWIRVLPFGVVIVSARSGRTLVWCLVAVAAEPARWLREFASEQLRRKKAESGASPDGGGR